MKEKMKNRTPWLNRDGTQKTDREILKLGQRWTPEIWNRYLDSELGTLQDEELVFYENMDTEEILERATVLKYLQEGKNYDELEKALLLALYELSKSERIIIKESFWKMATDKEIAERLNKTHKNVRVLKSRAIKKLGTILGSKKLKGEILHLKNSNRFDTIISLKKQWIESDSLTFR